MGSATGEQLLKDMQEVPGFHRRHQVRVVPQYCDQLIARDLGGKHQVQLGRTISYVNSANREIVECVLAPGIFRMVEPDLENRRVADGSPAQTCFHDLFE